MKREIVCGVPMGGLPGETPSLLVGSIFFDRQKLVRDAAAGEFDEEAAKSLLDLQAQWSQKTGNPSASDVIASTPKAVRRYLDFVSEHFDGPVMVDGSDAAVRIAGIEHMAGKNQSHRVIYNSICPESTSKEYEAIKECRVSAAVVLAVDAADFSAAAKIRLLTRDDGLLKRTRDSGVRHILLDPGIIDLPSMDVMKTIISQTKNLACFCGSAPHNAIGTWGGLTEKFGLTFKSSATAIVNALPIAWGGDFVIYGPMTLAPIVFPAVAMVDAILAQSLLEQGITPDVNHPMFKIA